MKKTRTETIVKNTYKSPSGVSVLETVVNNKKKTYALLSKGDLSPALLDIPKDTLNADGLTFKEMSSKRVDMKGFEDLEKYPLYYMSYRNGEVFDSEGKIVSTACTFDYIGSLSQRIPDDPVYAKLVEKLKEHPYVVELKEKEIEYYNSDFSGQKGFAFVKVFLPQEKYEELYERAREADADFWSNRINDAIRLSYSFENLRVVYSEEIYALLEEYYKNMK